MSTPAPERTGPSSDAVLKRALLYGGLLAITIAVVAGIVGGLAVGWTGVTGALVGTAFAVVFLGLTAASILFANRFTGSDIYMGAFFGIVLGGWLLKLVIFIVLIIVLDGASWLNPTVMFFSIVAAVVGSLAVDVIVVLRSRMPYASDTRLPGARLREPSDDDHNAASGS